LSSPLMICSQHIAYLIEIHGVHINFFCPLLSTWNVKRLSTFECGFYLNEWSKDPYLYLFATKSQKERFFQAGTYLGTEEKVKITKENII
jgi:hypothetical protein